jgi:SET domain-containing protein
MIKWFNERGLNYISKTEIEPDLLIKPKNSLFCIYENELSSRVIVPLRISKINSQIGYGCFAERDILPGEFIGEYTGLVREIQILDSLYAFPYNHNPKIILDAKKYGNETRFLNHANEKSEHCNLLKLTTISKKHWHLFFTARRFIEKGMEMRFDYGKEYFKDSTKQDNTYKLENQIAVPI